MNPENKYGRAFTIREEFNRPKTPAYYREMIKRQEKDRELNTPQYQEMIAREKIEDRAFDRAMLERDIENIISVITFVPRKISDVVSYFLPTIEKAVSIKY